MRTLLAVVVAGVASSARAQVNLLENEGFEDGVLSPWYQKLDFGGPEDWRLADEDAHTGAYSATCLGNKLIAQDFDPVPTSEVVEVSAWVRNPEAELNAFYLEYADGSSEQWIIHHDDDEWNLWDSTSQLDAGKELVSIGIWGYTADRLDDRTYVDDLRVVVGGGCRADLDGDGDADVSDFFTFLDLFASGDGRADIDGDGDVDVSDFFAYLDLFATGCG